MSGGQDMEPGSRDVAKAAVRLALSSSREDEKTLKERYAENGNVVFAYERFVPPRLYGYPP
jgi:hypothetical protein